MPWNVRILTWVFALAARLPLRWLHSLGAMLGTLARWLNTREYRVTRRNVELCFSEFDADRRRRFVRASMAETGKAVTELAWLWGGDAQRALRVIHAVHGRELVAQALAQGRGLLIAAPHLGAWELLNLYLSTLAPLTILYRVPQRPELEVPLTHARTALGAEAVRAEPAGVRLLFRRLKEGRMVGILPDQRPKGGEGEDALFFGHTAKTMTLLSRLAHKTGAPVLFAFARRLPRGAGFEVHFLPAPAGIADADLRIAVQALNLGLEHCIALAPEQYQWTYKRLSFRRKGEPDVVYGK
jgi:KDO2-lipid IV(A) lauroyltransferase